MNKEWTIYIHKNKINGKIYVGQTSKIPERRWQNGKGYINQVFYKAIQKYGWNNFEHIILEKHLTQEEANEREKYWINFYHSNNPKFGYNQTNGGCKNQILSENTKKKIKQAWTEEKRKSKSDQMKEIWKDNEERKSKQSKLMIKINKTVDRTKENNQMYGKSRKGTNAGSHKEVICIETGDVFYTIVDAARWAGSEGLRSHISQVCKGERNTSGKHPITGVPLHWKYKEN